MTANNLKGGIGNQIFGMGGDGTLSGSPRVDFPFGDNRAGIG
jgi:hypothetical protein